MPWGKSVALSVSEIKPQMLNVSYCVLGKCQDVVNKHNDESIKRTPCTKCMNFKGALVTPKGITKNSYDPQCILNAIYGLLVALHTTICQYPNLKSIFLNT